MVRRIHLLRHAKSDWGHDLDDHDRPLAPRGYRAVGVLAGYFTAAGVAPGLVLCSSARRATETLDGVRPGLPDGIEVSVEEALYGASAGQLLRRLQALGDGVAEVLVVAHNPGLGELARGLTGTGDPELLARLGGKFPTGALATIAFEGTWAELGWTAGRLEALVAPRDLG